MIRIHKVDANHQKEISRCLDCSAHEDGQQPPICLVMEDMVLEYDTFINHYPKECPLTIIAAESDEIDIMTCCPFCNSMRLNWVPTKERANFVACRDCGDRVYRMDKEEPGVMKVVG